MVNIHTPVHCGWFGDSFFIHLFFPEYSTHKQQKQSRYSVTSSGAKLIEAGPASYGNAVFKVAPAVVNVYATKVVNRKIHHLLRDYIFRQFFGARKKEQERNTNLGPD